MARLSSNWSFVPSNGIVPAYHDYVNSIHKSERDDRDYRIIRLQNGLQAMLVHDAKTDKAAASLDVAVGHLYDPDDMPGLAHFCEHLLFMGTEQFPRENEYSEFLARNNGSSNAYTATSNTNYYFTVATPALSDALARFAAFFHCPLFSPSCTSRELKAVDSEHKKNHQSDLWRIFQLNKHLSKEGHVWSKFGTGHRDSLSQAARDLKAKGLLDQANGITRTLPISSVSSSRDPSPSPSSSSANSETDADGGSVGRETRRRLVKWWSEEYCANRMRLCVIGKEPLDELAKVVSTLFSPIPNRGKDPLPMIEDHPFGPNEIGTLVAVQTIMSFHVLEISFPLDHQPARWRHKPANFLGHFLGHEGPGSLFSFLKNKGWVTKLDSGPQNLSRGFGMFKVTLHLTNEGFHNYRSCILATFKYMSLLRSSSLPPWNQKEISTIYETKFRFAEKKRPDNYATWISEAMAWPVERDMVLTAPQLVWAWDETGEVEVRNMLNSFTADKGRAILMAPPQELCDVFNQKDLKWQYEPWYGTKFLVDKFDRDLIIEANGANDIPELFLPGPNLFLPTNLDVYQNEADQPAKRPKLIRESPFSTLWYKQDDQFSVPKAYVCFDIRSPYANVSPRASVMTRLFSDLITDSLTEFSYDADLAGLSYDFSTNSLGMRVNIQGYNDKLPLLTKHLLEKIKNLQVKPERLAVMKEQLKRSWENFFMSETYHISEYLGRVALMDKAWLLNEQLPEIPLVTIEELEEHIKALLSSVNLRMLIVGNMVKEDAIKIAEITEDILSSSPAEASGLVDRSLILPQAANFVWTQPVPNPNEVNSSLTYYLHIGSLNDPRLRVTGSLLAQMLSEPAFNILRTREQLGYIVSCSSWTLSGDMHFGLRVLVQSERHPVYLEERVETFLDSMKSRLEEMEDSEFTQHKKGLEKRWREKAKNLQEEAEKYWTHIKNGLLDFERRDNDAHLLDEITRSEVMSLFLSRIHPLSATRSKTSVHLCSQKPRRKRISFPALEALKVYIQAEDLNQLQALQDDSAEEPTIDVLQAQIKEALPEAEERLMKKLTELVERYPAESDNEGSLKPGTVVIEDWKAFKSSLEVSEEPRALIEWNDLPVQSKM